MIRTAADSSERTTSAGPRRSAAFWSRTDWGTTALLTVSAFVIRRDALPTDGLFHDDAWAAASVTLSSPSAWWRIAVEHPGYNLLLLPLRPLAMSTPTVLVWPALVAGALLPAVVYWFLRTASARRSTGAALAGIAVAAPAVVSVSAHVKSYALDAIVMCALAALLPVIAGMRWTTHSGVVWVVAACALATISVFALIATAVAVVILVFHPRGDRPTRVLALVAQAAIQGLYLLVIARTYDDRVVRHFWSSRGGFIDVSANPLQLGRDVFDQYRGVVSAYPGRSGIVVSVVGVVALVGLIAGARRPRGVSARFLLAVLLVAALGGAVHRLPFGVAGSPYLMRLSVWLVPVIAYGLAEILGMLFRVVKTMPLGVAAYDAVLYGFALVVVASGFGNAPDYVPTGYRTATHVIDEQRGPGDLVVLLPRTAYGYAIETDADAELVPDRRSGFGTRVEFGDDVLAYEGGPRVSGRLRRGVEDADRVITLLRGESDRAALEAAPVFDLLVGAGFTRQAERRIADTIVTTWVRQ